MPKKKIVKQKEQAHSAKIPRNTESPESYLNKNPVWAFHRCDLFHPKWSITRCSSFYQDILDKLISYEGQSWGEIQSASGGRTFGTNNHFENVADLTKDAQKRITELHLDIDQIFSLRLTATTRLYGILENGTFYILWYDPNHEIYPSAKKHS